MEKTKMDKWRDNKGKIELYCQLKVVENPVGFEKNMLNKPKRNQIFEDHQNSTLSQMSWLKITLT